MIPQLKYHQRQAELWYSTCRFAYIPCGRQSGKTELALRRLVRYLPIKKSWPDPRYFYAAPTFSQAKRIAWKRLLTLIPADWIAVDGISKSDLTINTIFGSELRVIGLDKPHRIEGTQFDGGIIDENSDIKAGTFDLSILPALTWRKGWVWFTGVPKRFGVGAAEYKKRYEAAVKGDLPDSEGFSWPSSDIIPPDMLKYAQDTMSVRDFNEQFNATWLSTQGGIFYAFDRDHNVRPVWYNPDEKVYIGSDFNLNPMSWVIAHLRDSVLEVFDEIFLRNTSTPAALNTLLSRYANHKGGFALYGDATGKARNRLSTLTDYTALVNNVQLKSLGRTFHYPRSNPSVADRFANTNAAICNGEGNRRCIVSPSCVHLIDDLETRAYKPNTQQAGDHGDQGHSTDALGYLLYGLNPPTINRTSRSSVVVIR